MQTSMYFGALLNQVPMLLVYLGGIVFAALWLRRTPMAAMLTLIGLAMMLASTIGYMAFQGFVVTRQASAGTSISQMLMWGGIASSLVRAIGLALVVAGVFANRGPEKLHPGFDVRQGPPPMMPPPR